MKLASIGDVLNGILQVLPMLPYLAKSPPHEKLEKLMPWHAATRQLEHIRK